MSKISKTVITFFSH